TDSPMPMPPMQDTTMTANSEATDETTYAAQTPEATTDQAYYESVQPPLNDGQASYVAAEQIAEAPMATEPQLTEVAPVYEQPEPILESPDAQVADEPSMMPAEPLTEQPIVS